MLAIIFITISVIAIAGGGLLSAFSAKNPSRHWVWLSAYLVLVVGIIQLGLVVGWQAIGEPGADLAPIILVSYNLGSLLVLAGTLLKTRTQHYFSLVVAGSGGLGVSMVVLLCVVYGSPTSWPLVGVVALAMVILATMPIGVALSARHEWQK